MKKIILKGPRLTLRPISVREAPNFVRWFKDREVVRYTTVRPWSLKSEKKKINQLRRKKDQLVFSIFNEERKHVGGCSLGVKPAFKKAGLGIIIGDKSQWRKGYGREAIQILGNYIFLKLKYNRFDLTVVTENKRAIRCYLKSGFKIEGRQRQAFYKYHRFHDVLMMSVLRQEWLTGMTKHCFVIP